MGLMLDPGGANAEQRWQRMTAALGRPVGIEWNGSLEAMASKLVFDLVDPSSVTFCVNAARENARQVREEISTEQWQRLNRLFHHIHSPQRAGPVRHECQRHAGLGRRRHSLVQRHQRLHDDSRPGLAVYPPRPIISSAPTPRPLCSRSTSPELFQAHERENSGYLYLELVGLLRCCTAFEAYCQVYTADLSPDRILEFLLLNRDFPHAIRYCVDGIRTRHRSHPAHRRPPLP